MDFHGDHLGTRHLTLFLLGLWRAGHDIDEARGLKARGPKEREKRCTPLLPVFLHQLHTQTLQKEALGAQLQGVVRVEYRSNYYAK